MKNYLRLLLALACLSFSAVDAETVGASGSAGAGGGQVGKPSTVKIDGLDDEMEVTGHWGRCPTVLPVDRPKEHPPAYKTHRIYFPDKEFRCHFGGGWNDDSAQFIRDEYKGYKPDLNRSYTLYKTSDEARKQPIGTLRVKNGNGFIEDFKFARLQDLEAQFGKGRKNVYKAGFDNTEYSEPNVFLFEFDAIEKESSSFSKFKLAAYSPDGQTVSDYVIDGPGAACAQPLSPELQAVIQYVPAVGTFWVNVCSDENRPYQLQSANALPKLFVMIDQKIASKQGLRKIPYLDDCRSTITSRTSGRSERHQKSSPTLPEGAPIPDSR